METNKRLAQDFLNNQLSKTDRDQFFSSLKEKGMLNELSSTFDKDVKSETVFDNKRATELNSEEVYKRIKAEIKHYESNRMRFIFKIVASILLPLLIVNISLWYFLSPSNRKMVWNEIHVPKGETAQFIFQDGTKVALNADSRLTYPANFQGDLREVKLDGEGYFEVSKNPDKPFIVSIGKIGVKVYGTSFNVNGYSTSPKVIARLDEGKISLLLPNNEEQKLNPGEEAKYDCSTNKVIIETSTTSGKPSWQALEFEFDNINLVEVVQILERKYNVVIQIKESSIHNYNYHLKFNKASLEEVFDALQLITPIKVTKEAEIYTITKS